MKGMCPIKFKVYKVFGYFHGFEKQLCFSNKLNFKVNYFYLNKSVQYVYEIERISSIRLK